MLKFTTSDKEVLRKAFREGFEMPMSDGEKVHGWIELPNMGRTAIFGEILSSNHMKITEAKAKPGNYWIQNIEIEEFRDKPFFFILSEKDVWEEEYETLTESRVNCVSVIAYDTMICEYEQTFGKFCQKIGKKIVLGESIAEKSICRTEEVFPEDYEKVLNGLKLEKCVDCTYVENDETHEEYTKWKVDGIDYVVSGDYLNVSIGKNNFYIRKPNNIYRRRKKDLCYFDEYEVFRTSEIQRV